MNKAELRQDIVSGDWIIISPVRKNRREDIRKERERSPIENCPFEDPQSSGNDAPIIVYPDFKNWELQIIKNKYPVLEHEDICPIEKNYGPYSTIIATGYHDLIIMRDHNRNFPNLNLKSSLLLFQAIRDRYLILSRDKCIEYVSIFNNWGSLAGASIYHPHYQMIALPVIPPDVFHFLSGSTRFLKEKGKCVHCAVIEWEKKEKKRIIFENESAIAVAPFASKKPHEVRIFPKNHLPFFEDTNNDDFSQIIEALQVTLLKMEKKLGDPDYNFFIHTAPIKNKENYRYYHWHIEVLPKINIAAGFELGTGIEINPIDPDETAKLLQ
jgi:UDPglucose--hexose-1-phosphate uridylyltransferase